MPQARDEAGNIWEVDAQGRPVRLISAAGQQRGQVFSLPPDPMKVDANNRANDAAARAAEASARQAAAQEQANALALSRNAREQAQFQSEQARGGLTPVQLNELKDAQNTLRFLKNRIDELDTIYRRSFAGKGLQSVAEYAAPAALRPDNANLNTAASSSSAMIARALGLTGQQFNTPAEAEMFIGGMLPKNTDPDEVIVSKINRIKDVYEGGQRAIATKLGQPYTPTFDPETGAAVQQDDREIAVMPRDVWGRGGGGGGSPATSPVPFGQTTRRVPDPAASAEVDRMIRSGVPYEQANAWAMSQGLPALDPQAYTANLDFIRQNPGYGDSTANIERDDPMSGIEILRNSAVNNPLGAAIVGGGNALSMGGIEALAPGQYEALGNERPFSTTLGEVAGVIGATGGIGAIGRMTAGRLVPSLLRGGKGAQFGRNLAADATYGAGFGGVTDGDPLTGAVTAGVASGLGQVGGAAVGRALTGVRPSAPASYLQGRGVNMTVGQMLGGRAKDIEDAATSIPFVGDMVRNRRTEAFEDFNRAAFDQAGAPIGVRGLETGEAGLDALKGQVGRAYDAATSGVRVPLDPQFATDMGMAARMAGSLPDDYARTFDSIGQNRIAPAIAAGELTGEGYQQAMRGLKSARRNADKVGASGFDQEYRDAITTVMGGLRSQMERGGGEKVVKGLAAADSANRLTKTLGNAVRAARSGTATDEIQVFTPAQLNTAGWAAQARYPGPRPFAELADAGQKVLPSTLPDSGTARRLATMALPGALGGAGAGAGVGALAGGPEGAATGAAGTVALGALLALGGSKAGQEAIKKALFDRPVAARKIGAKIRKRKGLFGSAAVPLMIESGD